MTHMFTLARRAARLRALLLVAVAPAFVACDAADRLANSSTDPTAVAEPVAAATKVSSSSSFRGGIPFGPYNMPNSEFGSRYNGAMRNIWAKELLINLAAIKSRGGKVVLMFAGSEEHYKDDEGHFSMSKWRARVDKFKNIDFSSYVRDGTIIAHFLIDEPNDPFNWHDRPVQGATLDEMARYSKQLWPNLPTVARAEPFRLGGSSFRYLDAAWAQYTSTKGDVNDYIRQNVADAQRMGLALVVGLNITKGNISKQGRNPMTAQQVESWGSTLLGSSYPCAFISWNYVADYMERSDIQAAMQSLSQKAQNRPSKSCRGINGQTPDLPDPPVEEPPVEEPPVEEPPAEEPPAEEPPAPPPPPPPPPPVIQPSAIKLAVTGWTKNGRQYMKLTWSGARGSAIDLYRNGERRNLLQSNTRNDGVHTERAFRRAATYVFRLCERGTSNCSNEVTVIFR
jgi:hypothetical protein